MASTSSGITNTVRQRLQELENVEKRYKLKLECEYKKVEEEWKKKHDAILKEAKRDLQQLKAALKEKNAEELERALMKEHMRSDMKNKKERKEERHAQIRERLIEREQCNGPIDIKCCDMCYEWDGESHRCSCGNRRMDWCMDKIDSSFDSDDSEADVDAQYRVHPDAY